MRSKAHVPSPAMAVACISLAVALSGAGYAAIAFPRNSVGTKQLRNNAVTGAKVKNDALTGADVRESTLGPVPLAQNADLLGGNDTTAFSRTGHDHGAAYLRPGTVRSTDIADAPGGSDDVNANMLDGLDSTGFVQGRGNVYRYQLSGFGGTVTFTIPNIGHVRLPCGFSDYHLSFENASGGALGAWWWNKDGVAFATVNDISAIQLTPSTVDDYVVVLQIGRDFDRAASITVTGRWGGNGVGCRFLGQAVVQT